MKQGKIVTASLMFFALHGASCSNAEAVAVCPVAVWQESIKETGQDAFGKQLALKLKERIAQSPLYRLTQKASAALEIYIVSATVDREELAAATVVFTAKTVCGSGYLNSSLRLYGLPISVQSVADEILADLEEAVVRSSLRASKQFCKP